METEKGRKVLPSTKHFHETAPVVCFPSPLIDSCGLNPVARQVPHSHLLTFPRRMGRRIRMAKVRECVSWGKDSLLRKATTECEPTRWLHHTVLDTNVGNTSCGVWLLERLSVLVAYMHSPTGLKNYCLQKKWLLNPWYYWWKTTLKLLTFPKVFLKQGENRALYCIMGEHHHHHLSQTDNILFTKL